MSAERRIAALLRELAEQFDLLAEQRRPMKPRRVVEAPETQPDADALARAQRGLRRAGVKA